MNKDLRLELRCRNNRLWQAVHQSHGNVAEFCRAHDLTQTRVGDWLNLKDYPRGRVGLREAIRLCEISGVEFSEMFPEVLYGMELGTLKVAEVDSRQMLSLAHARRLALPPTQEEGVETQELHRALEAVLHTLTPREEKVLRLRFGLDDGREWELAEIGEYFDLSKTRVQQIEMKALRKIRHPSRSKSLQSYTS